jgi:hypothetical protein
VNLYLLAEFLDDAEMRAEILEILIFKMAVWNYAPGSFICKMVWNGTPKGSPLRSVMCEWITRRQSQSTFAQNVADMPKEVLEELAVLLMQRTSSDRGGAETLEAFAARMRAHLLSE